MPNSWQEQQPNPKMTWFYDEKLKCQWLGTQSCQSRIVFMRVQTLVDILEICTGLGRQWRGSSRIFRVAPTRSASVVLNAIPSPTLPQLIQAHKKAVGLKDFIQSLFFIHFAFVFQSKRDLITGLKTRTIAGRPNWDKVFKKVSENKKGRVTVFFCGPPQLGKLLKLKCDEFGFDYRKENF